MTAATGPSWAQMNAKTRETSAWTGPRPGYWWAYQIGDYRGGELLIDHHEEDEFGVIVIEGFTTAADAARAFGEILWRRQRFTPDNPERWNRSYDIEVQGHKQASVRFSVIVKAVLWVEANVLGGNN